MNGIFRNVTWDRLDDYLAAGWMVVADLGMPHARYGCLCEWRCACPIIDPQTALSPSSAAPAPAAANDGVPAPSRAAGATFRD